MKENKKCKVCLWADFCKMYDPENLDLKNCPSYVHDSNYGDMVREGQKGWEDFFKSEKFKKLVERQRARETINKAIKVFIGFSAIGFIIWIITMSLMGMI